MRLRTRSTRRRCRCSQVSASEALLERLHALGFTHLDRPASYYGLGLTLGSGEVSLWELVQAYATIARGGDVVPLALVTGATAPPSRIGESAYWQLIADMLADPHARAKSFGIGSVLQMPFPAAVKTGTSSDFRDTWTVGFTRDYTVGVWVGNFDGSAMRGVSGVTGAGPLWNRIMLHLYERHDEPPPFARAARASFAPRSARRPGTRRSPADDCPAVVQEWVLPRDLAFVGDRATQRRTVTIRGSRCRLPARAASLRIVFPHDGDVFVRNESRLARAARAAARATRDRRRRTRALERRRRAAPLDASGNAFWPLRFGTWRIAASDGAHHDAVTVRVVSPARIEHPGFTYTKESQ